MFYNSISYFQGGILKRLAGQKGTHTVYGVRNSQIGGLPLNSYSWLLNSLKDILPLRVPEERFIGLMNLAEVMTSHTTRDEIQNALVS